MGAERISLGGEYILCTRELAKLLSIRGSTYSALENWQVLCPLMGTKLHFSSKEVLTVTENWQVSYQFLPFLCKNEFSKNG